MSANYVKQRRWIIDLAAILILLSYAWLAWRAEGGSRIGGAALDPVLAAAQTRGALRVAVDVGFRPFVDERAGQIIGYDVDLARAVAERLGLGVEFVPTGFDALYDALTSDQADLVASALPYAPEQGYRARFSSFYFDAGQVLLVPNAATVARVADLSGRRVGVGLGSDADTLARRLATTMSGLELVSHYDEPAEAIADLRAGTIDAVICDNVVALSAVQHTPGLRIALALSSEPYVLAMPANAFQLQSEVNRALEELRQEDFFTRLNEKWFR